MFDADGACLAATQVGVLRRIFVYRLGEEPPSIVVNPVITHTGQELDTGLEGCLSLGQARVLVEVERPTEVTVEAQSLTGEPVTIEAKGMRARILQHEIDHLDGVLMLDRTSPEQAKAAQARHWPAASRTARRAPRTKTGTRLTRAVADRGAVGVA